MFIKSFLAALLSVALVAFSTNTAQAETFEKVSMSGIERTVRVVGGVAGAAAGATAAYWGALFSIFGNGLFSTTTAAMTATGLGIAGVGVVLAGYGLYQVYRGLNGTTMVATGSNVVRDSGSTAIPLGAPFAAPAGVGTRH